MTNRHKASRRRWLSAVAAMGVGGLTQAASAWAELLRRTPGQILGPFYPVVKPPSNGTDLTLLPGHSERAQGQVIQVMGRVLDHGGRPVPNARMEIWQANVHGRYTHPSDTNPAPLDPNFEGYATLVTDADGRYRFKTIKPGAYPAGPSVIRPPHIHFDVVGRRDRLVTQMYFAGEPLNDKDPFLQSAPDTKPLITELKPASDAPGTFVAVWDIVLENG